MCNLVQDINQYIIGFINKHGIRESSRILSVSPSTICHWKKGNSKPKSHTIQKLVEKGYLEINELPKEIQEKIATEGTLENGQV